MDEKPPFRRGQRVRLKTRPRKGATGTVRSCWFVEGPYGRHLVSVLRDGYKTYCTFAADQWEPIPVDYTSASTPALAVRLYDRYAGGEDYRMARARGYGLVVVNFQSGGWCFFFPLPGDAETQLMIELAARGELPLAILADRIDDVQPIADSSRFASHLTPALRRPDLTPKR
jgi:hypothetical protein